VLEYVRAHGLYRHAAGGNGMHREREANLHGVVETGRDRG
jgi:hypothetical protein